MTMSAGHEEHDTDGPFDMSGRDQVTLSAQERQSLAHLEARLQEDDPAFATRMRGRSIRWVRHVVAGVKLPPIPQWFGVVLCVVGLVTTLLAVDASAWLSVVTLAVTFVGALRIGRSLQETAQRRGRAPETID
jgi:hypothetical protein